MTVSFALFSSKELFSEALWVEQSHVPELSEVFGKPPGGEFQPRHPRAEHPVLLHGGRERGIKNIAEVREVLWPIHLSYTVVLLPYLWGRIITDFPLEHCLLLQ